MKKNFPFVIALFFATCIMASCYYDPAEFHGGLQSDGYLQYNSNGMNIFIPDSIKAGDPSIFLLNGYYFKEAAIVQLEAATWSSHEQLSIYLLHCRDTGLFDLGPTSGSSGRLNGWSTDSIHQGQVHLTRLDTIRRKVAGTFHFQVVNKNLSPDSISIDSGVFFDYPILIGQ